MVKKAISIIKAYYSGNSQNIPSYIPEKKLKAFSLEAIVLWKAWIKYVDDEDYGNIIDSTKNVDYISAESHDMTLNLGSICLGGHQGRKFGDKHLVDIQKVFDKYWPDVYIVKEDGECPASTDGRKAIRRYLEGESFEELDYWDKEAEDWD